VPDVDMDLKVILSACIRKVDRREKGEAETVGAENGAPGG
jgi:hypothetical protein